MDTRSDSRSVRWWMMESSDIAELKCVRIQKSTPNQPMTTHEDKIDLTRKPLVTFELLRTSDLQEISMEGYSKN